jgi:hypothetical protein
VLVNPLNLSAYPQCLFPRDLQRSDGLHLTDIIRDMAAIAGISKDSEFGDDDLNYFASAGFMWERIWDRAHQEAVDDGSWVSPGEFTLDGITGTPDRIDWSRPAIIETKVRWRSVSSFESLEKNYWAEITQTKAYCWMTKIMEADLVAFFIAGNWRPPIPEVRGVNLQFSELELEETWAQIVGHARWRGWLPAKPPA